MEIIRLFLEQYGIYVGLIGAGIVNFILLRERKSKTDAEAQRAATAQQNMITEKFTELFAENHALQAKLDALEATANEAQIAATKTAIELEQVRKVADSHRVDLLQAQERAARMEEEVKTLTQKVSALETEKASWSDDLDAERKKLQLNSQMLTAANARIAELQQRVSTLEGENNTFRLLLQKLDVVKVDPESVTKEER